jgi:ABC-2 type transport system permease protein
MLKNFNLLFLKPDKIGRKQIKGILLSILIIVAMIPTMFGIATMIYVGYGMLSQLQQEGLVLGISLSMVSMATFFFSIFYVMSVFYFSKDIESLLPLPLRPSEILAAKFTVTLIYEYVTEAILLLPALIGYGVAGKLAVSYYVYSAVVFLTLPIMPLVYASILSMVIMRFTNIAKNKDRFKVVGGVIAMFAAIGVNIYIQKLTGSSLTPQELEQILAQGNNSLANIVTGVFFNNRFAVTALINSSVLKGFVNIVIYILIAALSVVLFLNLGESLYFKGVIGLSQTASKRMIYSDRDLSKSVKERSALMAYTIKELKLLIRTPVYFMNCVLLNFLWPVFLMIPFFAQPDEMSQLRELSVYLGTGREGGIFLAVAFAISTFLTATNGITSSAISREGSNIYVCKYLPVGYKTQIMAKVLSGISMGVVAVFMMVISAVIIIRPPFYLILLTVLIGLLGVVFSSFTGILIDLNFPKLVWDNEQKAVKQNFNVVINLLLGIVASCIPVFVVIALKFTLWMAFLSLAVLFGVLDALLYVILSTTGVRLLSKIEE